MPNVIDKRTDTKKRIGRPWENLNWREKPAIPFENLHWWFDTRHGHVHQHAEKWDMETQESLGIYGTYDHEVARLTYHDVDAIYDIMERTDCTQAEATIKLVGPENLRPEWIQKALGSPAIRCLKSKLLQDEIEKTRPLYVYQDPEASVESPAKVTEARIDKEDDTPPREYGKGPLIKATMDRAQKLGIAWSKVQAIASERIGKPWKDLSKDDIRQVRTWLVNGTLIPDVTPA